MITLQWTQVLTLLKEERASKSASYTEVAASGSSREENKDGEHISM